MLKKTATFLLGTLIAAPAFADAHMDLGNMLRVSNLEDSEIYTLNREWTDDDWGATTYDVVETEWEQVGEVDDVVLDTSGQMVGIVAEVGGFLDIGDAEVFLSGADFKIVPSDNDFAILTRHSEEALEAMEDVGDDWLDD